MSQLNLGFVSDFQVSDLRFSQLVLICNEYLIRRSNDTRYSKSCETLCPRASVAIPGIGFRILRYPFDAFDIHLQTHGNQP